jgi:hypothetical protein
MVYSLGNVTLKGNFAKGKSYEINVTTLQAIELLAFNTCIRTVNIFFVSLIEATGIANDSLNRVLHSLL